MEIKIPLNVGSSANTYQELKSQLKQLELSVHHAQKAIESAEKEGVEMTEDAFICYEYPALETSLKIDSKSDENDDRLGKEVMENFIDNYYDELQSPELRINLGINLA